VAYITVFVEEARWDGNRVDLAHLAETTPLDEMSFIEYDPRNNNIGKARYTKLR